MKTKMIDLSKTLKNYSSKWVALVSDSNKVVATGNSPKTVIEKARKMGVAAPVLTRVPKEYGTYIL